MGWGRGGKLRDEDEEGMGCGEGLISFSHFSNEPAGLCCGLGCLACFHFPCQQKGAAWFKPAEILKMVEEG